MVILVHQRKAYIQHSNITGEVRGGFILPSGSNFSSNTLQRRHRVLVLVEQLKTARRVYFIDLHAQANIASCTVRLATARPAQNAVPSPRALPVHGHDNTRDVQPLTPIWVIEAGCEVPLRILAHGGERIMVRTNQVADQLLQEPEKVVALVLLV